jgi:hypothetical protein
MPGGPVKPRRTETTLEQPGSSIATPYIPSAVSMVRLLRVIAMNWASSVISRAAGAKLFEDARADLNRRPVVYGTATLPAELRRPESESGEFREKEPSRQATSA